MNMFKTKGFKVWVVGALWFSSGCFAHELGPIAPFVITAFGSLFGWLAADIY